MFVRVINDRSRQRKRVVVVHNERHGDQVRQRVIREIGTAYDDATLARFQAEGELLVLALKQQAEGAQPLFGDTTLAEIRRYLQAPPAPSSQSPGALRDLCMSNEYIPVGDLVWGEIYSQIGWDQVLGVRRWGANKILKRLILAQLEKPRSKRRIAADQHLLRGAKFSPNQAYQTMDYLTEPLLQKILRGWQQRARHLLCEQLPAVLYDTTTLRFESAREDLGELRKKGFSKDGKPHDVQVLLALLVSPEGFPLSYRIYPGNQYEGHTLLEALKSFQQEGFPRRMTVIADAGLGIQQNQQLLRQHGYHYVLGYGGGVRNIKSHWHAQLFNLDHYKPLQLPNQEPVKLLVLREGEQRILVTYSAARAHHDAAARAKLVDQLKAQVGAQSPTRQFLKSGWSQYLKESPRGRVTLDEDKINQAARWDGLKALVTARDNPTADAVLLTQYRQLWQIEDCFRTHKTELKIRPVRHWTDRRIRAHIQLCFMAFCCLQELQLRLRHRQIRHSAGELLHLLERNRIPVMLNKHTKAKYLMSAVMDAEVHPIMKMLGVQWPEYSMPMPI